MKANDLKKLKALVKEARRLENLITEIETNLSEEQEAYLDQEFFCIGNISKAPIGDLVSSIDTALHHTEEYPVPDSEESFTGNAESVYTALCKIKDKWEKVFQSKIVNTTHAFLIFNQWLDLIFKYTKYLCNKYSLGLRVVKITDRSNVWGLCRYEKATIEYQWFMIKFPEQALRIVIHESCHLRHPNHKRNFWQFYEDVCINEGILLERVLGSNKSFEDIKGGIPYRWPHKSGSYYNSVRESRVVNKYMVRTKSYQRVVTTDL